MKGGDAEVDVLARLRSLLQARGWTEYRLAKESKLNESTRTRRDGSLCLGFGTVFPTIPKRITVT